MRFVNEVKNGSKSYIVDDWVSISKNLKTFGVQNKILFSKFYQEDGSQRAKAIEKVHIPKTKTTSFLADNKINYSATDSIRFSKDKSVISLYGKAKISFKDMVLDADEITFNQNDNTGLAKNLVLTDKSGSKITGSKAKFKLNGNVEIWQNEDGNITVKP